MDKVLINESNDRIQAARIAISNAEFEGLRGQAMLDLKANLRNLQAKHKLLIKG
jgi:hypothetical protein